MKKFFKSKKRTFILIVTAMAAFLVLNGSFLGLVHNMFTLKRLKKHHAELDIEYQKLTAEYETILSGDMSYVEDTARVKYHMARKGEIEFRITK
jgi:cell division protein FtsB